MAISMNQGELCTGSSRNQGQAGTLPSASTLGSLCANCKNVLLLKTQIRKMHPFLWVLSNLLPDLGLETDFPLMGPLAGCLSVEQSNVPVYVRVRGWG